MNNKDVTGFEEEKNKIINDVVNKFKQIEGSYHVVLDDKIDVYCKVISIMLSKETRFDPSFINKSDIEDCELESLDIDSSRDTESFINDPSRDIIGRWYNINSTGKSDSLLVYTFNDTGYFTVETYDGAAAYLYNPNDDILKYDIVTKYEFISKTAIHLNLSSIAGEVTKMFFNNINIFNIKFIDFKHVAINSKLFKRITPEYKKLSIDEWEYFWNEMKSMSNTYTETLKKNFKEGLSFYEEICEYIIWNKDRLLDKKSNIVKSLDKMQQTLKMLTIHYGMSLQTDGVYGRVGDDSEMKYNDRLLRVLVIVDKTKKYMESL